MESLFFTKCLPYLQHKYFSNTVFGLLLVLLCYQLALITWMLVPVGEQPLPQWQANQSSSSKITEQPLGVVDLLKTHIFGAAEQASSKPSKKPTSQARATPLNVELSGIVSSSDPDSSLAIIESRGKQGTYGIGETIDGTQAKVTEILADRVIVDNRGRSEFIMLDGAQDKTQQRKSASSNKSARPASKKGLRDKVAALRKDPGKLTDYLRISPVRKNGEMQGYRLNPGKERLFFTEFDLKPNDLAVAFNGFDLKDSSQAMSVMKELSSLTEASITVERDGQLHDIFIQLP